MRRLRMLGRTEVWTKYVGHADRTQPGCRSNPWPATNPQCESTERWPFTEYRKQVGCSMVGCFT